MKKYIALGAIAIVLIAGAVHFTRSSSAPVDPRLVKADNDFAFRLYKEIARRDAGKNIFISPISIALALQMTYNGASGTTKDAMAKALGLQGLTLDEVNKANAALLRNLANPGPGTELDIATSVWAKPRLVPDFEKTVGLSYHAGFGPLKLDAINAWVNRQTKGKIERMIDQLNPGDVFLLASAIYFKGVWTSKFDRRWTEDMPFRLASGKDKTVPTMHQISKFSVVQGKDFGAIRLPYSTGRLSMYAFLPWHSLAAFRKELDSTNWDRWMAEFQEPEEFEIFLPRYELNYEIELNRQLKVMGMEEAFEGADFAKIVYGGGAWISRVNHKAVVEVNEEGTEAAAGSSSLGTAGGPDSLMFDHPFFFVIRDDKTGAILFMGSVVDPTKH